MKSFLFIRFAWLLVLMMSGGGCYKKESAPADSNAFKPPQELAELKDKRLSEVSGLVASIANPGLIWVHNDSGNPATVYLVDTSLNVRLVCKLKGVKNRDWEDIAIGPGPEEDQHYLYVADIGDNNARHAEKYIYRFEEPKIRSGATEITIASFETIAFRLEDGKKDTEALWVHPQTKDIYVVSKREKPVHVYALRHPFDHQVITALSIATLPLTQIVAADISPDGDEIIMKDYDNVYYWNLEGKGIEETIKEKPRVLAYTTEPQGEALGFARDGSGFYTLSEKLRGEKTFLYFYKRTLP